MPLFVCLSVRDQNYSKLWLRFHYVKGISGTRNNQLHFGMVWISKDPGLQLQVLHKTLLVPPNHITDDVLRHRNKNMTID